jgi:hypothetical protein
MRDSEYLGAEDIDDGVIEVLATAGNNRLGGDDFDVFPAPVSPCIRKRLSSFSKSISAASAYEAKACIFSFTGIMANPLSFSGLTIL